MNVRFVKMHGLGNDFIVIDCREDEMEMLYQPDIIKRLCNRRLGIGGDQVLTIHPSSIGDYKMRVFNADGSEVEMCGNGVRCVTRYLNKMYPLKSVFKIETSAGIIKTEIKDEEEVEVDMGEPEFEARRIPVMSKGKVIDKPLAIDDTEFNITCLSMGNPHCVIFCEHVDTLDIERYGPQLENHPMFSQKTNVEFVEIMDRSYIRMRVWERGVGITPACGTGACASVVASVATNRTDRRVRVKLDGGRLNISWEEDNHVYMRGTAKMVFKGEIYL